MNGCTGRDEEPHGTRRGRDKVGSSGGGAPRSPAVERCGKGEERGGMAVE
jgi:hypothetical protein